MIYTVISRDGELAGLYTSPVDAHERSRGVDGKVVLALLNENSPAMTRPTPAIDATRPELSFDQAVARDAPTNQRSTQTKPSDT